MTEDGGEAEGKEEPAVAIGVKRLGIAGGLQVCGGSRVTTNQGRASGMRKPGEGLSSRVSGGAKGGRSQGDTNRLTG